ncbi:hypothetical protein SRABI06_05520 [Pseudomonas brassicacearum]|nr:hypothetical protein SRABI06_05520 [Pseudomonas brassicacearum]
MHPGDQSRYKVVNNNKHDSSHVRHGDPSR